MDCVPDTHALVWLLEGNQRLSDRAQETLVSSDTNLIIPTIVLAEIEYLYRKSKTGIDLETVLGHLKETENCFIHPLDRDVVTRLPKGLEIHDGIIVATALVAREATGRQTVLITKDRKIIDSGIIETVW